MKKSESYIKNLLEHWRDFRLKLFFEGILAGAFAGAVVICFRLVLAWVGTERSRLFDFLSVNAFGWTVLWFVCLIGISAILGWLIKMVPMSTGSGIPQVKGILVGLLEAGSWIKIIGAKFIGGLLGIGAGLSLGREGPSVQLGAAAAQGVSRLLGRPAMEEKYLLTSGAAAGLAVAFNAPLSGVMFALEELHKNFSPVVLISAVAASVTADFITRVVCGQGPVFSFHNIPPMPFQYYPYVIVLGLIVGASGVLYNLGLVKFQIFYEKLTFIPSLLKPAIPLVVAGFLGFVLPQILGGGARLINSLPQAHYALYVLMLILVGKFLFTLLSYGTGVQGGIFMPLLAIGALTGNMFGNLVAQYLHVDPIYVNNFIILAMAAHFSAIVKAPITGSILILEMTGSFEQLLPLITVCMSAYIASDLLEGKPIYDVLLDRMLAKRRAAQGLAPQEHHDEEMHIFEKVVGLEAPVCNSKVCDIAWPQNSLLVGIRRGDTELIPAKDTVIYPGDYLIVMSGSAKLHHVHSSLQDLVGEENGNGKAVSQRSMN
ncbi:MAG: ClC family H(+)/Cl(-) exchange transporter [Dissulfurimicrobium sp.]|uniref:ClC family H(+)/Cl(-) exchange transporter n=1 Tax=Dissulfurimicrobium sp. TaxID=2022436 RepID=UPI00404A80D1